MPQQFKEKLKQHHQQVDVTQPLLYIAGEFCPASDNATFASYSPVTEQKITDIPLASEADVDKAVQAARFALEQGKWCQLSPIQRAQLLFKLADLIDANTELLAKLEVLDSGKPYKSVLNGEIPECAEILRYYAGWADKIEGSIINIGKDYHCSVQREPVGVCGLIIPWNYPLSMAIWKLGPSLAAGCSVILKPAEQTSLSALKLAELAHQAGFPKGAFNVLTGLGAASTGEAMVRHPGIDKIAFTGETKTAEAIKQNCLHTTKRLSFELGGKSPNIIFADCDLPAAVDGAINAIFSNMGQNCCAGSRTFIEKSIYPQFVDAFVQKANAIQIGCPFGMATEHGAQIDKAQFDKILSYIEIGKQEGATCVAGGERFSDVGYFIQPTVFADVNNQMRIAQEEIFGPVACLIPFDNEQQAIQQANDTPYGLAAAVWTQDLNRSLRLQKQLKAGTVWINCYNMVDYHLPFGGFKDSGIGRELGKQALDLYLETKTVTMRVR